MLQKKIVSIIVLFCVISISLYAQNEKEERNFLRKGNRNYKDSVFVDAEVNYHRALDANPKSPIAMYNLGNAFLQQNKQKEAMEQYSNALNFEKDKTNLAQIYHNMGVIFHSQKNFTQAIEAYKQSLRNNPKDDETRYNLALAQKQLKEQQQNQDQNQESQQDKQEEQKQDQQQNQNQQNEEQQPPESKKDDNQMSKENAEQLLKSVMQDEKETQEKVKKQQVIQGGKLEKDW